MRRSLFQSLRTRFAPILREATRRDFLKASILSSASILLGNGQQTARIPSHKRVVIIGAGFAGLACAYELHQVGYDVTVIDARDHVGGRVRSLTDFIPWKVVEAGGELVGSNHETWLNYAGKMGLQMTEAHEEAGQAPVMIQGKLLEEKDAQQVMQESDKLLQRLNQLARSINANQPWLSANADALDRMSLQTWLNAQADIDERARYVAQVKWEGKNAVAADRQSLLAFLTMIKGGGVESFWTDSENRRCVGGNQLLAQKLAVAIGLDRVILSDAVVSITQTASRVTVVTKSGRIIDADDVVLTAPPTTWKKMRITPALPSNLMPQIGPAVKYMAHIKSPIWRKTGRSPGALTDDMISLTWDGTQGQTGKGDVLQSFSGGPAAQVAHDLSPVERHARYTRILEDLYPEYSKERRKAKFVDWVADPFSCGGYCFPAPGEITTIAETLANGIGRLHFAGEYCCYKFIGYMEGALVTGKEVANKLARRDALPGHSTEAA